MTETFTLKDLEDFKETLPHYPEHEWYCSDTKAAEIVVEWFKKYLEEKQSEGIAASDGLPCPPYCPEGES